MKIAPKRVSLPPTMERPSPIGFPSSSLSFVISMVVSAPGTISQEAGWLAAGVVSFFRGEATGFLAAADAAVDDLGAVSAGAGGGGGGGARGVTTVGRGLVGLCAGERPEGFGASAGFGGSFGLFSVGDSTGCCSGRASSSSSSSAGGGGGVGGFDVCVGLTFGFATIMRTVPSAFFRTRAAVA